MIAGLPAHADQVTVRRHNLALVLGHLRLHGSRSRARLASELGLNKATVSSLVAELVDRALVVEGLVERGAVGRPGLTMRIDDRSYVAVGAEINIDYVSAILTDLQGDVAAERRVPLDTSQLTPDEVLARLAALVSELLAELSATHTVPIGLTVAIPGLCDEVEGTVTKAPNLGWFDEPVVDRLRHHLGLPHLAVTVANEANLAALAELEALQRQSRSGPPPELLLLTGYVGVGGGVVTGGELLGGARGYAGELGHLQVDRRGRPCRCGRRGCLETVVGLNALLLLATDADDPARDATVDVVDRLGELRRRAEAGDWRTVHAIDQVVDWLVGACGSLVNLFNPDVVVLGGYFAVLGPWIAERMTTELDAQVFAPHRGGARIVVSTLGFSAAARGGALLASQAVLSDPTLAPVRAARTD